MTPHQKDMIQALKNVSDDTEFCSGDMKKFYGYPHNDASKVLQQDNILLNFVCYSEDGYRAGKIRYRLRNDFRISVQMYEEFGN